MSKSEETTVQLPTVQDLLARIASLEEQVSQLTSTPVRNTQQREMTDEDAKKILTGEFAALKHNEAAQKLGLSYGQVYSCRGEYTFRHIHKKMQEQGIKNPWKK